MSPHVPQQDKSSGELLVTDGALERLLSRVVSYVIIENVSSVECFSTVSAFEFLPIIIQLSQLDINQVKTQTLSFR